MVEAAEASDGTKEHASAASATNPRRLRSGGETTSFVILGECQKGLLTISLKECMFFFLLVALVIIMKASILLPSSACRHRHAGTREREVALQQRTGYVKCIDSIACIP